MAQSKPELQHYNHHTTTLPPAHNGGGDADVYESDTLEPVSGNWIGLNVFWADTQSAQVDYGTIFIRECLRFPAVVPYVFVVVVEPCWWHGGGHGAMWTMAVVMGHG